ncbi:probable RNA-directed DNA polymerase from transposon BS [Caerostris extrusa]|uniref:Probable RNA-directed DNA polymerase from transposon BS n=1 Tax=Caerostris extrusa TaxID=172846 RepID=A0AAV4NSX5_CAEEX|nr:probable RNA-directed DNA polymerase from transposon BS [Caerostris extrusa]
MDFLVKNNLLHFFQTAYRAKHSTVDQWFYLSQSIINCFQETPHRKTVAVFLDLSAAFDRVWRKKLVHIIHSNGIKGNALLWINDLLRARKFSVRFKGARLKSHRLWAGVPQGSVLCPLLFLMYVNTIHSHIHSDTRIACYADDIAIWYTHRDTTTSQKAINVTLKNIAICPKDLKLSINADKTTFCVFSTDRKHRGTFNLDIKINDSPIKRIDFPTNLSITLDPELRFTRHIVHTANKALRKLSILRKLCGTTWGSRPKSIKNSFCSIIRPMLEYAAPIWNPSSQSSKIDSVQHRASKIIILAVSSTNNNKTEQYEILTNWGYRIKLARPLPECMYPGPPYPLSFCEECEP